MEKLSNKEDLSECDQSQIVVDESSKSAIILSFDAQQTCKASINLLNFKGFEKELGQVKQKFKQTMWELKQKDEDSLRAAYKHIVTSKTLNVECLIRTDTLKEDHKASPNILAKIDSLIKKGFKSIRKCRGDGNCYYRAVYYAYLENLINKGEKTLGVFIDMLKDMAHNSSYKFNGEKMFNMLIQVCEQIYQKLVTGGKGRTRKALQHLFQSALLVPEFDLAAVQFLRELLYRFLLSNKEKKLSGLQLEQAVIGDAESIEDYCEKIVRKMGEEARSLLLPILPLILRTKIFTVVLDTKAAGNDVYIEECSAEVKDYESPFDKSLDFKDDSITLLLKPGHYDILYKVGAIGDSYDAGFSGLIELIFKNKEKEKEEQYEMCIRNMVKTQCCHVSLEKEEYMKSLIDNNIQKDSSKGCYMHSYTPSWIKCICGNMLDKKDLSQYFSPKEIESTFAQVKEGRQRSASSEESKSPHKVADCSICGRPMATGSSAEPDYHCACGNALHASCAKSTLLIRAGEDKRGGVECPKCKKEMKTESGALKTPCCKIPIGDKEAFISDFLEYNNKKKVEEKVTSVHMICPLCTSIVSRVDLEKSFAKADVERIVAALFSKSCAECTNVIADGDHFITSDCGHYYHVFCAEFIMNDASMYKKCRAKGCEASLTGFNQKIKQHYEQLAKLCANCGKGGDKFGSLECSHYVCYGCAEAFRKGENSCFEHYEFNVQVHCNICNKNIRMTKITLQCTHVQSVQEMRRVFKNIREQLRKYKSHDEIELPVCDKCEISLNDVEIYALAGKVEGTELLSLVEEYLKAQKEAFMRSERKKSETGSPKKQLEPEPEQKISTHMCSKCKKSRLGFYRYNCDHEFLCKECIKNKTLDVMLANGLSLCCKVCQAATGSLFLNFVMSVGDSEHKKFVRDWKKDNMLDSVCCPGSVAIRLNDKTFRCEGCKKILTASKFSN